MHLEHIAAALISASECPMSSCDPTSLVIPLPAEVTLAEHNAPVDGPVTTVIDESWEDLGEEGYSLYCHQEGHQITAKTKAGLFYGQQTLEQMKRLGLIPCCTIEDKPRMKIRSVMLDLARLKEKHEYYYYLLDQLAEWKINTVFLHLTDDQGCALEFKKHPKLATKYAFTQDEMGKLIKYAADRHIDLIPEIEPWGHAKYITSVPEYADLVEDPENPKALCTSNPKTFELLADLFEEIASLFPSKYIHAGCDEARFGKCERCQARIESEGPESIVAEHVRRVCDLIKANGKIPMIWGDVPLNNRASVDLIPKDTIICHWDYEAQPSAEPVEFLKSKGFEVIVSPAIVWCSRMILPTTDTIDNVANTTQITLDTGCLGMETTVWIPQRYIADTLAFALAHAAELSWSGIKRTRIDFAAVFAKNFYGLDPTLELAQAILDVHDLGMKGYAKLRDIWEYVEQMSKAEAEELKPDSSELEKAMSVADTLRKYRPDVAHHPVEYDSYILAADVRALIEERAECVRGLVRAIREAAPGDKALLTRIVYDSLPVLEQLAIRDADIAKRVDDDWNRWRYADDPKKQAPAENLLASFGLSRRFFETMPARLKAARQQMADGEQVDWEAVFARE